MTSGLGFTYAGIVAVSGVAWWAVAPAFVSFSDRRLKSRNPDHHARMVRFHRGWGLAAILLGASLGAVALGG